MKTIKICMIGFGNVAHGVINALIEKSPYYKREFGLDYRITAITDIRFGTIYEPEGLPLEQLADVKDFSGISGAEHPEWNTIETIRNSESDVIVELSYTDLKTGEPAVLHCREAILSGKHVITSNKGPIALHYKMLNALARDNNVRIGIEGTVMSGSPALRVATDILQYTGINEVKGILNGTTNFILCNMEDGKSYEEALKEAQELGYAEANPAGDVEGHDTAGKVAILSQLLFGQFVKPEEIDREGITDITLDDIQAAKAANSRWKLIGSVQKTPEGIKTSVKPMMIPLSDPLAGVAGAGNAIQYKTDLLGDITLFGPGAGRKETAAAIIEDLMHIFN